MDLPEQMRRDWDERARRNAFRYIASWKREWDLDSFLESGRRDYAALVMPALERCGISSTGSLMVELGCGAGRMTACFSERFKKVLALDLSAEMLERARLTHKNAANVLWLRVDGSDLACIGDNSADFIFSYLVLQHLPSEELVFAYVREMLRVLQPMGAFLFQFNGSHKPTMNLRGRLAWGAVDTFWSARMPILGKAAAKLFGLDPCTAGKSWRGAAIDAGKILAAVASSGGEVRELAGKSTPMAWCCGVKKATD